MEKKDIIKYVLTTPTNTNPAILDSLLDELLESNPPEPSSIIWIEWDGVTTGRAKVDIGGNYAYKVINTIFSKEDFNGMNMVIYMSEYEWFMGHLSSDIVVDLGGAIYFGGEFPCISGKAGEYHYNDWTITIPEDGTYFLVIDTYYVKMLLKNKENS